MTTTGQVRLIGLPGRLVQRVEPRNAEVRIAGNPYAASEMPRLRPNTYSVVITATDDEPYEGTVDIAPNTDTMLAITLSKRSVTSAISALVSLDGNLASLRSDSSLTVLRETSATLVHGTWASGRTGLLVTERVSGVGSDHRVLEIDEAGVVVRDDRVLLVPPPAVGAWSGSFGWHPDGASVLYREREVQRCGHTFVRRRHADRTETVFPDPAWVADVIVYTHPPRVVNGYHYPCLSLRP